VYESLIGLAFTNAYIGVVAASKGVPDDLYEEFARSHSGRMTEWYFDHSDGDGALWIAIGGQHAEPLIAWLHRAQERIECMSMLAAVIDNGAEIPLSEDLYAFEVGRQHLDTDALRWLTARRHYMIYQPYTDEFRILVSDLGDWRAIRRALDEWPSKHTELTRRAVVPRAEKPPSSGSRPPYDPIYSQIQEVMVPLTQLAGDAVGELLHRWQRVWPPVPEHVQRLKGEIAREKERIDLQLQSIPVASGARDAVLTDIDRYAGILRTIRRQASQLESQLQEIDCDTSLRSTVERVATPLMLRALERYTSDVAQRLRVKGYKYIPVIGEKFAVTSHLFPDLQEDRELESDAPTTAVVEIPAEVRMRLGAFPMIARELAWLLLDDDLNRLAVRIVEYRRQGNPWAVSVLPKLLEGNISPDKIDRHRTVVFRSAREIAADLIAAAVVGAQYVFAMARFAVGTLSQSELGPLHSEHHPAFRKRLAACLALWRQTGNAAAFSSIFLSETGVTLPDGVVDIVRESVAGLPANDEEVDRVTLALCAGRVVEASPVTVLAALWRAVAARGRYLNEVAAVISIAAAKLP
jgi:hypothetical protein